MKRIQVVLMVFLLTFLCLSGCGDKKEGKSTNAGGTASKDYVYKASEIDLGLGMDEEINRLFQVGSDIYGYSYNWNEEGQNTILFYKINEEGGGEKKYNITLEPDANLNWINMDSEGNLYAIKGISRQVSGTGSETDASVDGEGTEEYVEDYYLTKMDIQGEEVYSVYLNEIPEIKKLQEENGYFYVNNFIFDRGKAIYLIIYGNLLKFDMDGNLVDIFSEREELENADYITTADGKTIAVIYGDTGISTATVDLEKGTFGEKYAISGVSYEYSFYPGVGYDLYLVNTYGLYGYNLGDADKTQLMSYIDSDFDFYNLYQVMGINDKELYAMYDDPEDGDRVLAKFTKVPPEEVKERQEITLAMAYTDWNVRQEVVRFNKSNEAYRISILDYASLYGTDDDYKAGIKQLNADIASGKVPDIILLDETMPVDSYISKGLFEDLKPYIDKDSELDINEFMPNIIEAFSVDGKLYTLVPSYTVLTLMAKAADVGNERGWTVQEVKDLLASKPEGTQFLADVTQSEMMERCISMSGNQFVDWENGNCNFNSDEFIQMLEFISTFPEEIDRNLWTEEYWENYESMWREGKVLALATSIGDFRGYSYTEKGTFGEKVTMIGFPSSNGEGSVIQPRQQLALSSKSKCREGAWEFLKVFLQDEYQEKIYGLPVSIKCLDKLATKAMEKPYYMDENNEKVEYDDTYYISGVEIIIPPMTAQETEELKEQLYSFTQIYKFDEALFNIINEEAAPYFAGQKSAKDVAGIIQSRVQIYVNENR